MEDNGFYFILIQMKPSEDGQAGAEHKDLRVISVDRAVTLCECPQKVGVETEE